jgi:hypothetical protein
VADSFEITRDRRGRLGSGLRYGRSCMSLPERKRRLSGKFFGVGLRPLRPPPKMPHRMRRLLPPHRRLNTLPSARALPTAMCPCLPCLAKAFTEPSYRIMTCPFRPS